MVDAWCGTITTKIIGHISFFYAINLHPCVIHTDTIFGTPVRLRQNLALFFSKTARQLTTQKFHAFWNVSIS